MAAAAADASAALPAGKGKKKLIILLAVALLVLGAGGAAAVMVMKRNAAAAAMDDGDEPAAVAHKPALPATPPTYVALDPFTVNLADKETERFAQVAITLEVDDPKFAEQMKAYMPSIRSNILMVLAHKSSGELLERAGKEALAREIKRESVRPMGIEVEPEEEAEADDRPGRKRRKKRAEVRNPVTHVHFANFIIQ